VGGFLEMGRRAARETAMKLLYQLEFQKEDRDEQIKYILGESDYADNEVKYINDVIDGVHKNLDLIDRIIEKYSKGWKINRLSKVDLSILRLSIYEIKYREDIPFNVSVNEAVELAKKYSNEDAGSFVNGLLAKVTKLNLTSANSIDEALTDEDEQ
jgi:transcription antitermination protein NusB